MFHHTRSRGPGMALLLLLICQAEAAISLSITPNRVSTTYPGEIRLNISGVQAGESVLVERWIDANGNGVADAPDFPLQSFTLTDNSASTIGGVINRSVPRDLNAASGRIESALLFPALHEPGRSSGSFVFTVKGVSGTASAGFTITQPDLPQGINGSVRSGGNPVAGAVVVLFTPGEEGDFVTGAVTDSSGNYSVRTTAEKFIVAALAPGYLTALELETPVVVNAGATVRKDLILTAATGRSVSGRVVDSTDAGRGLSAGPLFVISAEGLATVAATDSNGNFNLTLPAGMWEVELSEQNTIALGYVAGDHGASIDTTPGNVTTTIPLLKATALLHGTIKVNPDNTPLAVPVRFSVTDDQHAFELHTYSDAEGNYAIGVVPGRWDPHPSDHNPGLAGYVFAVTEPVTVLSGQAVRRDVTVRRAEGTIRGTVRTADNEPLAYVGVWGNATIGDQMYRVHATTDMNGAYQMSALNGTWHVGVNSHDLQERGFQTPPGQTVSVNGNEVTANFVVASPTAFIRGRMVDESGNPISFMRVFAFSRGGMGFAQNDTDGDGRFTLGVGAGSWSVQVDEEAAERGLIRPEITLNLTDGSEANGVLLIARRATMQISGTVRTTSGTAIPGVRIFASHNQNGTNYISLEQSDGSGNYSLPIFSACWSLNVDCFQLEQQGFSCPQGVSRCPPDLGRPVNFAVNAPSARLSGRVVDETGAGVRRINLIAFAEGAGFAQAMSDENGNFDLPVNPGTWNLQLSGTEAGLAGIIGPSLTYTVTEGQEINGILVIAFRFTANISGFVKTSSNEPVGGLFVFGSTMVNGTNYFTSPQTDANGNYRFGVFNATWQVSVDNSELNRRGFQSVPHQTVTIAGGNPLIVNFNVPSPNQPLTLLVNSGRNGQFSLEVRGSPGKSYVVQHANSLNNPQWQTLRRGEGGFTVQDSMAGAHRFYRAVEPTGFVTISGRVVDKITNAGVSGAVVSSSLDSKTATSDINGNFTLQTETPLNIGWCCNPYNITVTATGYKTFSGSIVWGETPSNQFFQLER